jgi:iron complex transport system permease protein
MAAISTAERIRTVPVRNVRRRAGWLVAGLVCLAGAGLLGLFVGPVQLGPIEVLKKLVSVLPFVRDTSHLTVQQEAILLQLRLPRVVLAALIGGTLSISGAAYQGAFRNPLADPYLLGSAAGAGLGATLAIAYTHAGINSNLMPVAAFAGALAAVALAYTLGRAGTGARTATSLILAGIAVMSFFTAAQTYLQQRKSETLREVYSWILGRLSTLGWRDVLLILPYITIGTVVILAHRRLLDVLALGDEEADTLGVNTRRVRLTVVIAASLSTAAAVAVSGLIGFVGIIVPHIVRLLAGTSYRMVLPMSLIFGASFLILCDLLGRTLTAPAELPIGVVTAFFGAPFFAIVLRNSRKML